MPDRDAQTVVISRSSILLVTAMGVGQLTLVYVLGVQVGKQSAALRATRAQSAGEDLKELPSPVAEQLKAFGDLGLEKAQPPAPASEAAPAPAGPEAGKAEAPKADPEKAEPPGKGGKAAPERWSLQLLSTPDAAEAKRVAEKAKAAGFAAEVVKQKGQLKVRLVRAGSRAEADAAAAKLKAKGFSPFAVKAE